MPNNAMVSEGKRKEIYYISWYPLQKEAKTLQVIVLIWEWAGLSCKALLFLMGSFYPSHKDATDQSYPS
jgi:hypothetical protein